MNWLRRWRLRRALVPLIGESAARRVAAARVPTTQLLWELEDRLPDDPRFVEIWRLARSLEPVVSV
jgi:hypothetical protein